jgi:hypothetical protein
MGRASDDSSGNGSREVGSGKHQIPAGIATAHHFFTSLLHYVAGMYRYGSDFFLSYLISAGYFQQVELQKLLNQSPRNSMEAYWKLFQNNLGLMQRALSGSVNVFQSYGKLELGPFIEALFHNFWMLDGGKLAEFAERQARLMEAVVHTYPAAIQAIEAEYGFHFERGDHELVGESDRFCLYRIIPSDVSVRTRATTKPILILPPYVLGANILGFLPAERRSYAHCFANQGIPTYIRVLKDIRVTEALQRMTGEDDALDTRRFCEIIKARHSKPVTLNGYCQGGFNGLCDLLSGELDGLVDAFITCVAPMDGTRSKGLNSFLKQLTTRFNDLAYGTKTLPNGNQVADGRLMGWIYKLKSIESEQPISAFFRDLLMFSQQGAGPYKISKTAAALNYWLNNERYDLPLDITRMSFASYNTPISADGTLPVQLFGRKLNVKRIAEKNIPWLICYGIHDDLVEKETALAPLDYVQAEVTPFPKGHVAIATSWSDPGSACALHTRFGEGQYRGPVLFHLDLDEALNQAKKRAPGNKKAAKPEIPAAEETKAVLNRSKGRSKGGKKPANSRE